MLNWIYRYWLNFRFRVAQIPNYSILSLILSNCVPLFGVLFWRWDIGMIMGLYWFENVVIGFINVIRMFWAGYFGKKSFISALFVIPVFILHYGIFAFIHGVFVYYLFIRYSGFGGASETAIAPLGVMTRGLSIAMLTTIISHGISLVVNFIGKREYDNITVKELLFAPYKRVAVMHLAIIIGATILTSTGSPTRVIAALVVIKTAFDLVAHVNEHIESQRLARIARDAAKIYVNDDRILKEQNPNIRYK